MIFLLLVVAIFAPLIVPYNPLVQTASGIAVTAPNAQHWFGTDEFGRDIFSRLVYGSRITPVHRAASCRSPSARWGWRCSVRAGYFGGKVDMVLMRRPTSLSPSRAWCWRWHSLPP